MDVIEAIRSRSSIRGFKPAPVPREVLEELLDTCRWAPSLRNAQTCEFAMLGGEVMAEIKARLDDKLKAKAQVTPDLPAAELSERYLKRATANRDAIDIPLCPPGTEDPDATRVEFMLKGGRFYDAPNGIIIYADKPVDSMALINAGTMAQTIAPAALAYGLGTCITTRGVGYPEIFRELIGIPESKIIITGIAIGYPDPEYKINSYTRQRVPLEDIAQWYGF
jgi:nitroreductase